MGYQWSDKGPFSNLVTQCSPSQKINDAGGWETVETYPNKLNDGAELQLLLGARVRFGGCFDHSPTQPSHHFQKMTPVWCLYVEGCKSPDRQRYDVWDPA